VFAGPRATVSWPRGAGRFVTPSSFARAGRKGDAAHTESFGRWLQAPRKTGAFEGEGRLGLCGARLGVRVGVGGAWD